MTQRHHEHLGIRGESLPAAGARQVRQALAVGCLALAGCAPTLDWRELSVPGADATALFPCRPASQSRTVVLADAPVNMTLYVCTAGRSTYALTSTDVGDPARVARVLRVLKRAAAENLAARSETAPAAWQVPGMTPSTEAGQWRFTGQLPDGTTVQAAVALAVHGTRVVQVSVIGPSLKPDDVEPFLEALRFGH